MVKASVIIPTMGSRRDYLEDALRSIERQSLPKDAYEILLVDNNPTPTLADEVKRFNRTAQQQVRYVHEPRPGSAEARHAGARQASGEILVFTDDDVLVSPEWLKSILEPFQDPAVGCAGGKTLARWECPVPPWLSELQHMTLGMLDLGDRTLELRTCQLWSNNLAVRRSVLFEVGGFHPDLCGKGASHLIWYAGDGECGLEQKILERGYKLVYEPRARIHHRVPASRATKAYICERSYFSAITPSFAEVRRLRGRRLVSVRLLIRSARYFVKATALLLTSYVIPHNRLKTRTFGYHYSGMANHQLRAALSAKLRQHVFRESYLEAAS